MIPSNTRPDHNSPAGELVENNWQQIETLADILIWQEIVDGGELERIMDEKRWERGKKTG